MFDFAKYNESMNPNELVNVWLSDDDLMIVLSETQLKKLKQKFKDMDIPVKFTRLTRRQFYYQLKGNKWEQVESDTWKKVSTIG